MFKTTILQVCCLAMRGDTSSIPLLDQPFNTTYDLIKMVSDPKHRYLFSKNTTFPYDRRKNFQINFHSVDSESELFIDFVYGLLKTIEDLDLNIDFCTGSRSLFWDILRTCIFSICNYKENYIADSPFQLMTSNGDKGEHFWKNYITIFNPYYGQLDGYCYNGYPEWFIPFGFPIIIWEPSHEFQVQRVKEKFFDPACQKAKNYTTKEHLRISSNLEVEMVQVYWKQIKFDIQEGFDPLEEKVVIYGNYSQPVIDYSDYCKLLILGYVINGTYSTIKFYTDNFTLVDQANISFQITNLRAQSQFILVQGVENYTILRFAKNESGDCSMRLWYEKEKSAALLSICKNTDEMVSFTYNDNYTVSLQFFSLETDQQNGILNIDLGQVLRSPTLNLMFDVHYDIKNETYVIGITFTKFGLLVGEQGVKITNQIKIYLAGLYLDKYYNVIQYIPALHHVDFGTTNDLKIYEIDGELYMLAIHTNGICQSAILLNNNQWNKCMYENYEQYEAISNVDYLINYFWGNFKDILENVITGAKVSGCDRRIMHAKVGNGALPSGTIREKNGVYEAFVVSEFVQYEDQPSFTKLFCGSSNDYNQTLHNGIQLFSFDLVHPSNLTNVPR